MLAMQSGYLRILRRPIPSHYDASKALLCTRFQKQCFSVSRDCREGKGCGDPRLKDLGDGIVDAYAKLRQDYKSPKYPIILAHGLFGFSQLNLGPAMPPIHYWRGITEALTRASITHHITSVPPSSSIADRAAALAKDIRAHVAEGQPVSIIAHSMGGLDARYMISKVCSSAGIDVRGLVTVATPHRGSPLADYLIGHPRWPLRLDSWYGVLRRAGFGTEAFAQLTTSYMKNEFNASIQDISSVRYFSYGAAMDPAPSIWSPFYASYGLISSAEGPNDGLVSVESSHWGEYKGTLVGVSHLDLINWSNRVVWTAKRWVGIEKRFNAVAFYLDIADMLAKEGL